MSNDDKQLDRGERLPADPGRREFVALTAAAGLAARAGSAAAAALQVEHKDVEIQTGDGTCDAAFFYPSSGSHPGVIVWTDIFGLRPTFRQQFGQRLAASGYAVLIPNPFYRTAKAPVYTEEEISHVSFTDPAVRAKMQSDTGPMNKPGAIETDAKAHVAFLDSQSQVDTSKKIGVQGYCMGGPLVFRTVASQPDRIGAGATFHGGGLVTDKPDSPHLLIPKFRAQMYVAIAASDDMKQPEAKDQLKAKFAASDVERVKNSTTVVYTKMFHGWTVPDMPHQPTGEATYNKPEAEVAWRHLLQLYRTNLV